MIGAAALVVAVALGACSATPINIPGNHDGAADVFSSPRKDSALKRDVGGFPDAAADSAPPPSDSATFDAAGDGSTNGDADAGDAGDGGADSTDGAGSDADGAALDASPAPDGDASGGSDGSVAAVDTTQSSD